MKRLQTLFVVLALPAFAMPAQAQWLFKSRSVRPVPAQRVPELVLILKTDSDERKRAQAAEELREYDAKTFTEIVPVLIDVLGHDKKSSVRLEALSSLAHLRPISQAAGQALEHSATSDESLRVRLHAKSALLKYHIAGYSANKNEPSVLQPTMQEPPLGDPNVAPAVSGNPLTPPTQVTTAGTMPPSTPALPDLPRPLPAGVALPPGQSAQPPTIQIEGPTLPPRPF
jgi:hypothetical protein